MVSFREVLMFPGPLPSPSLNTLSTTESSVAVVSSPVIGADHQPHHRHCLNPKPRISRSQNSPPPSSNPHQTMAIK